MMRKLPDGKETSSIGLYVSSWESIGLKVASLMNWRLAAFDPGFYFIEKDSEVPHDLDVVTAQKIIELAERSNNVVST